MAQSVTCKVLAKAYEDSSDHTKGGTVLIGDNDGTNLRFAKVQLELKQTAYEALPAVGGAITITY